MRQTLILCLAVLCWLTACTGGTDLGQPTLIPTEYLPTAVELTLQARGVNRTDLAPASSVTLPAAVTEAGDTVQPAGTAPAESTQDPISTQPPTPRPMRTARPTATLAPPFPEATVQIYRLGERSLVISPIQVTTRLTSGWGKVVRIELYGEDGRLLARDLRTYQKIPWNSARIDVDLQFEISAAAEAGRLLVSVEDAFGRLIDVNSVNLILLSSGSTQVNPATALWQRLIIAEPKSKALIQGGIVAISGRALPNRADQPLRAMLVDEAGRILGQRLARVVVIEPGNYGTFAAEISYSVTELTRARLVIFEEGEPETDLAHLASIEVVLAP